MTLPMKLLTLYNANAKFGNFLFKVVEDVDRGYRMPKPNLCPDKLYEIMMACWRKEPQERPTFETLQWQLEDFYQTDPKQYKELDK